MSAIPEPSRALGRVLGSKDSAALAGTAFLFRIDGTRAHWFTCYHVLVQLREIWVSIQDASGVWQSYAAKYEAERSTPQRDIAVLSTEIPDPRPLASLAMGDCFATEPSIPNGAQACLFGFSLDPTDHAVEPRQIFSVFQHCGPQRYSLVHGFPKHKDPPSDAAPPWATDVMRTDSMPTYELTSGHHLAPGLSGGPVCYLSVEGEWVCFGMFAQIRRDKLDQPVQGAVIRFDDLFASAGTLIPFYPYSECLIITLAGTRDEVECLLNPAEDAHRPAWGSEVDPEYYGTRRDEWRPFGVPGVETHRVVDLLKSASISRGWQLAGAYIEDPDSLVRALRQYVGAVFIVDPYSFDVDALQDMIRVADQIAWKASYMFLRCAVRCSSAVSPMDSAGLLREKLPFVAENRLCRTERYEVVDGPASFRDRIGRLVQNSWKVGFGSWSAHSVVESKFARMPGYTAPVGYPSSKPGF